MSITDNNIRLTENRLRLRPPAVAGMFYPADPDELRSTINSYLSHAHSDDTAPKAIIAPHAGYIYSGPVAAEAYAALASVRNKISKVILLGPAHRVYLHGLALPSVTAFATPLGTVHIDRKLAEKIQKFPQVSVMDSAHQEEHSLEVHLPFLQTVLENFTLLPLVVGDAGIDEVSQVLEAVWGGNETLIVISSDLSHYHDYNTAREIDASTSQAIKNLQLDDIGPHQACGCMPMRGLLNLVKQKEMEIRILDVRNSGDTAGTHDRVVGYGAYSIHYKQTLSTGQRRQLIDIARQSIKAGFNTDQPLQPDVNQYEAALGDMRACFVTLKIDSVLRGCIGTTQATAPLVLSVAESAFNAAFKDPRFRPLSEEEFEQLELSISVLSPPVDISFSSEQDLIAQLQPGIDGLIIEKGLHKATFLPEVWESLPDTTEFLAHLKQKAGIADPDMPEKAWRYHSEHFSEKDT